MAAANESSDEGELRPVNRFVISLLSRKGWVPSLRAHVRFRVSKFIIIWLKHESMKWTPHSV